MRLGGKSVRAAVAAAILAGAGLVPWAAAASGRGIDFAGVSASVDARQVASWAWHSGDTGGRPFAIVDKKAARLFVFDAAGGLVGATPALLGQASGDESVPGVGQKKTADILPFERTTPAGRFASEPGRNLDGEHVVWVEYETGFAIHRVRPGRSRDHRLQRLASETPADMRLSLGCVVVPEAFYDQVIFPVLGRQRGVVYVLPETRPVHELFGGEPVGLQDL